MVLHRLARARSAWAPLLESRPHARQFHASSISRLHEVPNLSYKEQFEARGVPGLLDQPAYDVAWRQNMEHLVERLNKATMNTDFEQSSTKQLILQFARNPQYAPVFAAASMAHNTHFFFDGLGVGIDSEKLEAFPTLEKALIASFGNIDTLWRVMLSKASAMTGPGFVWLVQATKRSTSSIGNNTPEFRLLVTYNAGTPYAEAGVRQQGADLSTSEGYNGSAGSFGPTSTRERATPKLPPGTELITPVLCVSTWEHAYLRQYGVGGKQQYLINWWKAINWGAVDQKMIKPSDKPNGKFVEK
ncbi:manganese and iron superoxide dismutase [Aureobasidium pullulans]|nr:manganese and iron superoxide dismutase [Aureobasidium pullulans]